MCTMAWEWGVADLPAMRSYPYLWETMALTWVIMEGVVPDIKGQDSTVHHKIVYIYHSQTCARAY